VAGERVKLVVQNRAVLGSAESRRLRKQGLIPGVLYGREEPVAISIPERDLRAALTGDAGTHAVLDVVVDSGKTHSSVLKTFQQDPVRGYITHVDLQEVRLDQPIHAAVAIALVGEPAGVKEGGVLNQVTTTVNVEALPLEIPESIQIDISGVGLGESIRLSQAAVPAGVTILDDLEETVVASVALPRAEVEEPVEGEEAAEGEEGAGAPAAEGEEAPEAAAEGGDSETPDE
jgi:large subunit ribosomal protein L25